MYQVPYISSDLSNKELASNREVIKRMSRNPEEAHSMEKELINTYLTDTLSKLREVADNYSDTYKLKYFNQDAVREWRSFQEGIDTIKPNVDKLYENNKDLEQLFVLGDISIYRGDMPIELYRMGNSSNQNIAIMMEDEEQMYYGMKLIYENMNQLSPTKVINYLVKSDLVLSERYLKKQHFNFEESFREFPYEHYERRVDIRKNFALMNTYLLDGNMEPTLKNIYDAQLEIGMPEFSPDEQKELLNFINEYGHKTVTPSDASFEEMIQNEVYLTNFKELIYDDRDNIETVFATALSLVKHRDEDNKITSRSFNRLVYYVYGLDREESISGVDADTQKMKYVFKEGSQYGIYVVFVTKEKGGLFRVADSIGITLDRTSSIDILSAIELKRHTYYGEHFMRFTKLSKKETDTLIFKTYRLDMAIELGDEEDETDVMDFSF